MPFCFYIGMLEDLPKFYTLANVFITALQVPSSQAESTKERKRLKQK